jgi:hypothetical protein
MREAVAESRPAIFKGADRTPRSRRLQRCARKRSVLYGPRVRPPSRRTGPEPVIWSESTSEEVGKAASAGLVAVLPIGAVEQHGPHLPAGTDALLAEHAARLLHRHDDFRHYCRRARSRCAYPAVVPAVGRRGPCDARARRPDRGHTGPGEEEAARDRRTAPGCPDPRCHHDVSKYGMARTRANQSHVTSQQSRSGTRRGTP